jgi:hypothetical protein
VVVERLLSGSYRGRVGESDEVKFNDVRWEWELFDVVISWSWAFSVFDNTDNSSGVNFTFNWDDDDGVCCCGESFGGSI